MGIVPVSWQEIESWQRLNGIELQSWEVKAIRDCSAQYVYQSGISKEANCQPPVLFEKDQKSLARHIKNIFRG